jgi:hypothetical protein
MVNQPTNRELASDGPRSAHDLSAKHPAVEHPETFTAEQSSSVRDTAPLNPAGPNAVEKLSILSINDRDTVRFVPSAAHAGSKDNVLGRVEKLRKISSVVIDQAAYDPSLRFLLVAAALFLLFLLLLILSKVIG